MENNQKGFTLIELMIGLAIGSVVLGAIVMLYVSQTRVMTAQRLVSEMSQNARTAIYYMENEIRMAGFSPRRNESWAATIDSLKTGIVSQSDTALRFTYISDQDGRDNNGDNTIDEENEISTIEFALNGDQIERRVFFDNGTQLTQILATGIERFEFDITPNSDGSTNVGVSLLVMTSQEMPHLRGAKERIYRPLSGAEWKVETNLSRARRLFTTSVQCRNTGV